MAYKLGVDIGGTFTDFLLLDERTGEVHVAKVPSTPVDPSEAVVSGVERICSTPEIAAEEIVEIIHGTTVATNAVLEARGSRVGLVTTEGFDEILHLGRGVTPGPLAGWITMIKPDPLADLEDTIEARERLDADGNIVVPLDEEHLRQQLSRLLTSGIESLSVSLLHSYANDVHERRIAEIAQELGATISVTVASDMASEFREYERTETAVVNAYIKPSVSTYFNRLKARLVERGLTPAVNVIRSDGGMMTIAAASESPVHAMLSGPAGGVAGAVFVAAKAGRDQILTFDMGGTSTDVCLSPGSPSLAWETKVGNVPVKVPSVDIATVGAGGGSIAHVPELTRALRVGPQSSGADPGPACYGKGGTDATVTDASLVLGLLPSSLLGGEIELDEEAARAAVGKVGEMAGLNLFEAAEGILQIVNENMLGALRVVTVERGLDPRDFALVAFGGAGPMHANELAKHLGSWPVLVPNAPGVLSALGDAVTLYRNEFVTSIMERLDRLDPETLDRTQQRHSQEAQQWLEEQGIRPENRSVVYQFDMRYYRQGLEIPLEISPRWLHTEGIEGLRRRFSEEHERLYNFSLDVEAEIVNLRVTAMGPVREVTLRRYEREDEDASNAILHEQDAFIDGDFVRISVYDRAQLQSGNRLLGPAVITATDSTTVILPDHHCEVDEYLNLLIYPDGVARRDS